ncbi:archaeosortase/exosortase family protein [Hymenobacter sp. YC55]|uniref:exosortase X n=1 Tax=Hymenobacter sp. YC55 TaxID=3034019 RepID=UPI0023F755AF|nr:archaeosortase/exosortase family protein [Hymenobacter sp. YC55]MDF7812915.1 archaeosortase/exosortase family protein [Hymenobacter sp. YC55]
MTTATAPLPARSLRRFAVLAVVLYLIWFFGYEYWVLPDGRLNSLLSNNIAATAAMVLRAIGFPARIAPDDSILIMMGQQKAVYVGDYCNGLVLYALFTGFVLAYPGPLRRKVWFIPAGIFIVYLLNVVRVAALAVNFLYSFKTVDFNHHYTFTFIVYGCIFLL